jgi:hypothetical protein
MDTHSTNDTLRDALGVLTAGQPDAIKVHAMRFAIDSTKGQGLTSEAIMRRARSFELYLRGEA